MKKPVVILSLLIVASLTLAACSPPPPLRSDKYLKDTGLISDTPCAAPCFQNVIVGQTKFTDAVGTIKANPLFSNVQTQDAQQNQPATVGGDDCCQMTTNDKGIINAMLIKLAPNMTAAQLIAKYGSPTYVTGVDYSAQEVAIALIFPKPGVVAWVSPGDASSTLKESDPVVVALYLDPADFANGKLIDTATLKAWNGYLPYRIYQTATPVVTPRITATPQ